jgi:hypothetical protein
VSLLDNQLLLDLAMLKCQRVGVQFSCLGLMLIEALSGSKVFIILDDCNQILANALFW